MSRTARLLFAALMTLAVAGLAVVAVLGAMLLTVGSTARAAAPTARAVPLPAPTTAAGYQRMFAALPVAQWGGADVAISVPMGRRSVWLFGDTLSDNHGIVNSTAITQDGGSLHVSHEGNQLLPQASDDAQGRRVVYWIEAARRASATQIQVTVAPTWVSNDSASGMGWGRTTTLDRTGLVTLSGTGDVDFDRWTGWAAAPVLDKRFLDVAHGAPYQKAGVLFYGRQTHPEDRLAGGKTLVTICQNRIAPARLADGSMDYAAYRPVFSAS